MASAKRVNDIPEQSSRESHEQLCLKQSATDYHAARVGVVHITHGMNDFCSGSKNHKSI